MACIFFFLLLFLLNIYSYRYHQHKRPVYSSWESKINVKDQRQDQDQDQDSILDPNKLSNEILDAQDSYSLLSMINMIQEISSSKSIRFRQSAEKIQENFVRVFSLKYSVTKDRLMKSINVTARLETIPNYKESQYIYSSMISQLKSIEIKPTVIIFSNEPLYNLDTMKYPFDYPIHTLKIAYISKLQSKPGQETVVKSVPIITEAERGEQLREKGRMLSLQNLFSRLRLPTNELQSQIIEKQFLSKFKLGLRLEALKWRLGNKFYSYLLKDSELILSDNETHITNGSLPPERSLSTMYRNHSIESSEISSSISKDINIDFLYENYTVDNLSRREINPIDYKLFPKRWRSAMTALEDVSRSNTIVSALGQKVVKDINYPLLLHSVLMLSQATYNLRLSSAIDDIQPTLVEKIGQIINITNNISDSMKDMLLINATLDNARFYLVKAIEQSVQSIESIALHQPRTENNRSSMPLLKSIQSILKPTIEEEKKLEEDLRRSVVLARHAVGCPTYTNQDILQVHTIQSDKACAIITYDKRIHLISITFRGTKDPIDIITDATFVAKPFVPYNPVHRSNSNSRTVSKINATILEDGVDSEEGEEMKVHAGFLYAFQSIVSELDQILLSIAMDKKTLNDPIVLLTGHSMGGALAQIASAYYARYQPYLITIGAPAIGNRKFCSYIESHVYPIGGGIRLWNEFDIVPYLALVVGFEHVGIPIKMRLSNHAKEIFKQETNFINPILKQYPTSLDSILPHILYQIGSIVYVFPVLGLNLTK